MSEGFATQPTDLEAAAERLDETARAVADAVTALRAALDGLGNYVGDDEQGRAFAARYAPKVSEGVAAMTDEVGAVRSLADALRSTAGAYQGDDHGNAGAFRPHGR